MKLQINTSELNAAEISALKMFFLTLEKFRTMREGGMFDENSNGPFKEDNYCENEVDEVLKENTEAPVFGGYGGGGGCLNLSSLKATVEASGGTGGSNGNPGFGGGFEITALDAGLELDINGLSWDATIHTKSKSKTPEGAWKLKRNLETKEKPEDHSTFIAPGAKLELPQEIIEPDKVVTFNDLFLLIRQEIDAGKIIAADVITGLKNLGYAELPQLKDNPEGINALIKVLGIGHE